MTAAPQPHWTTRASCRPDPRWTTIPTEDTLRDLRDICRACPVQPECATEALRINAESGVWAGVWLPDRTQSGPWHHARKQLRVKAGIG